MEKTIIEKTLDFYRDEEDAIMKRLRMKEVLTPSLIIHYGKQLSDIGLRMQGLMLANAGN